MAGLSPNIRLTGDQQPANDLDGITVEYADENQDTPDVDDKGNILKIEHGDGSVTISLDGGALGSVNEPKDHGWFANLVEDIDPNELGRIGELLIRGVDDDMRSRQDWVDARADGMKLLGLKLEVPGVSASGGDGAPIEGMSKVRHPLLLESTLRFQANARAELLPADGPVKVRNDDNNATLQEDQQGNALQSDFNHYLTVVAKEYYPDTDRMLLLTGFGGTAFKKVYFCPLRSRPVSESVDADDLIVNNAATDLANAKRVTHRVLMKPSTVKRMQILGVYRDVALSTPLPAKLDSVQREKKATEGVSPDSMNPDDRDREIYECYCELDIKGFEHKFKGKVTGLEIPYRVTIDVSSREILSIIRNYNDGYAIEGDGLPTARRTFVKYTFVPGFGFYDIGLLHILGNTTNALTAAWREMLDNGMYANFPGFLYADVGGRQNTNIFRVPPGGGAPVKTNGMNIQQAVMPLPYNTSGQAALQSLTQDMAQTGQRVGGTSEMQVGEGRADAPVGTTLAMIEQAKQILNSVHTRLHAAQAEELDLIAECFAEHPESFLTMNCPWQRQWDLQTFMAAISNCNLVPRSDPNTASYAQRMAKLQVLKQLQQASPQMYDALAIDTAIIQGIGYSNPNQFFAPAEVMGRPTPEAAAMQAGLQIEGQKAQASMIAAGAKAKEVDAKIQQGAFMPKGLAAAQQPPPPLDPNKALDERVKMADLHQTAHDNHLEADNRMRDRESAERLAILKFVEDVMKNPAALPVAEEILRPGVIAEMQSNEAPLPPPVPDEGQ